jgi:hypothetical protein
VSFVVVNCVECSLEWSAWWRHVLKICVIVWSDGCVVVLKMVLHGIFRHRCWDTKPQTAV